MRFPQSTTSMSYLLTFLLAACAEPSRRPDPCFESLDPQGAMANNANTWSDHHLAVCWESLDESTAADRALVRETIDKEITAFSAVEFLRWNSCAVTSDADIRIAIRDTQPHTVGLGKEVKGRHQAVVLNFSFQNWGTLCSENDSKRASCIRATAVHEFMHVLGFAHEDDRDDTPTTCRENIRRDGHESIRDVASQVLGPWDSQSVLNRCNPVWNNDGHLSAGDRAALVRTYGPSHSTHNHGPRKPGAASTGVCRK